MRFDYDWSADVGTLPVTWTEQGDEWMHRLGEVLSASSMELSLGGYAFQDLPPPTVEVHLRRAGVPLDARLFLASRPPETDAVLCGFGEPPDELLQAITQAARAATERLGLTTQTFEWTAIIGPSPVGPRGLHRRLLAPARLGPLQLESTNVVLEEYSKPPGVTLNQWTPAYSMPMRIRGTSTAYTWPAASRLAARDLRTLCGLLALAWQGPYEVREAAAQLAWGERQVPVRPGYYREDLTAGDALQWAGEPSEIPVWYSDAWNLLERQSWLRQSLDIHTEALYATPEHPSLASVAYVAAIESIAKRLYKLPPPCPSCKISTGLTRSFREVLRLVLPDDEAVALAVAYKTRSKTVHEGRLSGGETMPGAFAHMFWSGDTTHDFRMDMLRRLENASSALLRLALSGNLPTQRPLPPAEGA